MIASCGTFSRRLRLHEKIAAPSTAAASEKRKEAVVPGS